MTASNILIKTGKPAGAAPARPGRTLPRALAPIPTIARNMFGLDYRSLALVRIGLGTILLGLTCAHAYDMRAFYTDAGVLPRVVLFDNPPDFLGFSLHFADGGMPYIATLFGLQMVLAFMMLVGYRTRPATVGAYILLLSMQHRQPYLVFGADDVVRVGLFWSMFLPLSKRFSVDRLMGRTRPPPNRPYFAIAGIGFVLQICIIYTGGSLMKTGATWRVDHTAVACALALGVYGRPLGHWLGQFSGLTRAITIATVNLECYGPALFILPVLNKWGRLLGIALFASLQIGFNLCMTLGYFGPVMITLSLAFLPPYFWERFAEPLGRTLAAGFHKIAAAVSGWMGSRARDWIERIQSRHAARARPARSGAVRAALLVPVLVRDAVLIALIVVMVLWNIGNIPGQRRRLAPSLDTFGNSIGLDQNWGMFSPDPQDNDGWFVAVARLRNGKTVDLISGASPATFEQPASISGIYPSQIWMFYLSAYWNDGGPDPELYAQYLATTWNERHSGNERLVSIEIDTMWRQIGADASQGDFTRDVIWTERFW